MRSYGRLMCMPPVTRSGRPSPVESPIAERDEVRRRVRGIVQREAHAAVVLEPHQALRRGIVPVVVGADDATSRSPSPSRSAACGLDAPEKSASRCIVELQLPGVLQPLHAVPRPPARRRVVERVAVAVEKVDVAVLVEIDGGEPARSEVVVGGAPDQQRLEPAAPVVDEARRPPPTPGSRATRCRGRRRRRDRPPRR